MTTALLRISDFDNPLPGCSDTLSIEMRVLRLVDVEGMNEVLLCELFEPLKRNGQNPITHVAVSPRLGGGTLNDAPFGGRAANLAYVIAQDAVTRDHLTPQDVELAGFGTAAGIPAADTPQPAASAKSGWFRRLLARI